MTKYWANNQAIWSHCKRLKEKTFYLNELSSLLRGANPVVHLLLRLKCSMVTTKRTKLKMILVTKKSHFSRDFLFLLNHFLMWRTYLRTPSFILIKLFVQDILPPLALALALYFWIRNRLRSEDSEKDFKFALPTVQDGWIGTFQRIVLSANAVSVLLWNFFVQ